MYQLLAERLYSLAQAGEVITLSIIGAGQMGTDIISQVTRMPGLKVSIVADLIEDRAREAYETAGCSDSPVAARTIEDADRAIAEGRLVVTDDYRIAAACSEVDVVIDATGSPEIGARSTLLALRAGKHVVLMTVETDITVGPILKWYADRKGVVYTLAAGDEPAAIMELYGFSRVLGFEIVAVGKGKNNPLDQYAVPSQYVEEAQSRGLTPEMLVEFIDGSKTNIEMAAVSNATGLVPDRRGMHGPRALAAELTSVFSLQEEGGVLTRSGVVDYVIGDICPGVFAIIKTDQMRLRQCMVLRTMGCGPRYLLYRPYHLCSIETPLSAVAAMTYRRPLMAPLSELVSEVISIAKKDLVPGDRLARIGGDTHFGVIDTRSAAKAEGTLPIGLAQNAVVIREVDRGQPISLSDVELNDTILVRLRTLQDCMENGGVCTSDLEGKLDMLAGG